MTEHLTDSQILALVSGQVTDPEPLRRHVAECPACRDKQAELRATWLLLGRWQAPAQLNQPPMDWRHSLINRVNKQRALISLWRPMLHVAAAILLAVGAGLGAAWYSAPATIQDNAQLAASNLYLESLSARRSAKLESVLGVASAAEVQP